MISSATTGNSVTSQPIDRQEPTPSTSVTSKVTVKAGKYALYGACALGSGLVSVLCSSAIQSHFDQPAKDFVYHHCLKNLTSDESVQYNNTLNDYSRLSFFASAVVTGSIMLVTHHLFSAGKQLLSCSKSPQPNASDTTIRPESQSAAQHNQMEMNELSTLV
ncbi:hypothetical protein [Endozoicomonas sp. SCSIO W0465]|uniref:hypothetical protein n=1 Tax=Endozoicomonas sp. SCSIO W0465 TaxID=2918516 RepID=UPI002075B7EE|nr:hypothetical protein [Endozoicomonas sp. SCSIO W0465]USE33944.1 hypothetical protein MJO57_17415 [Endozoicomonas sp. SCSIO W0465]